MNDQGAIIVVSTVPTIGYMLMQGLTSVVVFILCAVVAYYLLKHAGFDLISFVKVEDPRSTKENKDNGKIKIKVDKQNKNSKTKSGTNGVSNQETTVSSTEAEQQTE